METTRTRTYTFAAVLSLVVIVGAIALLFLRDDSANDSIPPAPALESLSIHEAPTTDILELAAGTTADSDVPETETEPVEETPATVVPDGPPSLRGTITDLDGDPVEGAQVSLLDATGWQATTKDMKSEMQGRGDPRDAVRLMREAFEAKFRDSPRAQSQEDGSYAFYGLPESEFRLFVSHEGYLRHAEGWAVVQSGSTFELNIELAPGYRIAGKVLDDKGRPVASASIAPVPAEEANQRSMGKLMRTFTTIVDGSFFLGAEPATTSTDGSFEIHSVEPIEYVLKTKASGWLPSEVPSTAGAKDVVIRLSSGGSVSGRVVNAASDPVAAATWTMGPEFDVDMSNPMVFMQADIDFFGESVQTGTTGEDGTFKVQGLEPGSYDLKIRVEEHPTLASTMDVEGAIDVGDLVLEEARHIAGMVRGPDGSPVADARVWIPAEGGVRGPFNGGNRKIAESRSEGDGSFVLENLPEGTFEVHAASNDFAETSVKDVQAGDAGIELRLETGVSVAGRVLDATTREPIVDVKVTSPWARSKKTRTDERGDFFMRGISGRRLKQKGSDVRIFLVLQHPDYGMKTDQVQGQKEVPEALPEFLLEARMYLSGVVVDPDGEPVTGARLRFEVPGMPAAFTGFAGGDGMQGTSTARDGSFEVSPPVGNQFQRMGQMMQLTVSHPRYAQGSVSLERIGQIMASQPPEEMEIELRPGTQLEGHVRDPSGSPISGARLQLNAVSAEADNPEVAIFRAMMPQSDGPTVYARKNGGYRIPGLAEGDYKLTVGAPEFVTTSVELSLVGEAPATQDVTLSRGGTLEGRVVDFDGRPLGGVEITLNALLPVQLEEKMPGFVRQLARQALVSAKSGDSGEFRLEGVGDDDYDLLFQAPGYSTVEVRDVSLRHKLDDVVLERLGNIGGRVTDATTGNPVKTFRLTVNLADSRRGRMPMGRPREIDDADGQFFQDHVEAGRYTVTIEAEGFASATRELQVRSGGYAELNVGLETGSKVTIEVRQVSGKPIAEATVQSHRQREERRPSGSTYQPPSRTGDDGRCELDALVDGTYSISAQHPDFYAIDRGRPVTIAVPADIDSVVAFAMKPAGRVQGTISGLSPLAQGEQSYYSLELVGELDEPLGGTATTATRDDDGADEVVDTVDTVDDDASSTYNTSVPLDPSSGRFQATSLPPGTYQLTLRRATYGDGQKESNQLVKDFEETVAVESGKTENLELRIR